MLLEAYRCLANKGCEMSCYIMCRLCCRHTMCQCQLEMSV